MTLQLHKPDGRGALVPTPPPGHSRAEDWRKGLRSTRWHVARLRNTEMNPTPTYSAVAFWVALAVVTFLLLVGGFGTGFWH